MLAARGQSPDTTTIRVTSRLVVLDVSVTDRLGHFVTGLDASQFTVREGKAVQTIRNFEAPAAHTLPAGQLIVRNSADLGKIGNAPVTILVLDEMNTPFTDRAYAQQQMERYLKKQSATMSAPTLLLATSDRKFTVIHDYTQNRDELLDSVKHHFPDYPWASQRGDSNAQLSRTLGALEQIADSSRGTPGRKNVIWVGKGYPSVDETQLMDKDTEQLTAIIQTVTRRLMDARVTLYTIDPAGVQVAVEESVVAADTDGTLLTTMSPFDTGKLSFSNFATATGGSVLSGRNDIERAIADETDAGGSYYTLSYIPTDTSDDAKQYRQIHITLKDPSLRAVTRDGYFAGSTVVDKVEPAKKVQTKQLMVDLMGAAQTTLVYNGLHVEGSREKDHYNVLVKAHELHWDPQPDGSRLCEMTVLAVAFNARGRETGQFAAQMKEGLGPTNKLDDATRLKFVVPFLAPFGSSRVRIVVRDATTGAIGTANAIP